MIRNIAMGKKSAIDEGCNVVVRRSVRSLTEGGGGPWTDEPQSLHAARLGGRLSTNSGTISVSVTVCGGPYEGLQVVNAMDPGGAYVVDDRQYQRILDERFPVGGEK